MTKNPILNTLAASGYIILISLIMFYGTQNMQNKPDTLFAPIAMISLFTFSAASMAYIFFYQPFQLYFDGKKKEAVNLALRSIMFFGAITAVLLIILFSGFQI